MTIGIGIIAQDGIVLSTDSQISIGDAKVDQGRVRGLFCSDPITDAPGWSNGHDGQGACILAGAGQPDGYIYNAAESICQAFKDDKTLTGDGLKAAIQQALADFHDAHVVPYLGLPSIERPAIEFLIAYGRGAHSALWWSDNAVLNPVSGYRAIGIGKAQAISMLQALYRVPPPSLAATVMLASLVTHRVKQSSLFSGKGTDILCLRGSTWFLAHRALTERMEALWDRYGRAIDAGNLHALLGEQSSEASAKSETMREEFADIMIDLHHLLGDMDEEVL